jgi:hypothetical protein
VRGRGSGLAQAGLRPGGPGWVWGSEASFALGTGAWVRLVTLSGVFAGASLILDRGFIWFFKFSCVSQDLIMNIYVFLAVFIMFSLFLSLD